MDADAVFAYVTSTFDGLDVIRVPDCDFVYYDPKREIPHDRRQPFVTISRTDAYDQASRLGNGRYRLNMGVRRETYRALFGPEPRFGEDTGHDLTRADELLPHPVYASLAWVSVVCPERTWPRARELIAEAHAQARERHGKREAAFG